MKLSLLPKSNLISIFFSKKVFLCLVFLCFVGSVFGAEYVWTGGGDGSTWTDENNWGGSGFPGESDNARFSSGAEVTITSDITVNQIYLNASSKVTCDSNVTISLNSIITQGEFLNKGTLQKRENVSFIIKVEAGGKLINENKIICTDIEGLGNSNITNNGTIEASGAATFQSGANFTNADTSELSIDGAMRNEGAFTNSGGTVTVKGTTTNTGTITNTGDFTSEGEIKNNDGGKITNNSSGTISGNINNTGGTVTNNGGTISDEVSGGTFEDNPIVVYSTIDSPDKVLDWTVDSSWKNGVKPNISGKTAVTITLNGDVNISDFQAFFSEGNKTITLNGTGNLLYNGKKIYISQKSDTELNWNTAENWINGVVPIITGEGKQEVVIVLNSDFISSETLVFNNATGAAIHIYLCNKKLSANSVQLVSDWTHPANNPAGNIHFYGSGIVETKILDASNNTNRTSTHMINLYDGTIFKITEHAYADPARGEIIDKTENCEVYLPASGFDMRVPSGKGDGATFRIVGTQAKAIEPQSYYKIELTPDISDTEKIFTFSRSETGKHNYDLNFPYVVYLMGDASWKLGDTELSDGFEGNVTIPSDNIENGTSKIEKTISLSSGTVESGDGIKVVFYTPCKNLVLNEFIYEKEIIYWTGDVSEDFLTPENWTFEGNPLTNLGDLTGKVVKIPSSYTRAPKLSSDISLEKLVVEDRAEVTIIDNGKLTVEKIHIYDSGALKAESGTVVFSGENPSYFSKYPEFSKFGTIEVASGTFNLNYPLSLTQLNIASGAIFSTSNELVISSIKNSGDFSTTADLHIKKSLTNNGTFQAEKVYFEPSENEVTIIGQSGDSEIAEKTKISELYCINQAGKNLVINNAISVEKIALSGIENASDKRLTVKYDEGNYTSGFIYLENNYDEAKYLSLADSLVTIKNATITVYESDTQNIPASNFVEKGWRLGDPSEFIWVGKTDDWNDPTNWDYGTIPTPGKPVKIPTGLINYPVLDTDINLIDGTTDTKEDSLIIESGAKIDFAGNKFSVTNLENSGEVEFKGGSIFSTSINNSGTVILTGKEEISGEISESGTVIYSGTETDAKFSWGSNYKNLEIQDGFTGSFENGVIISDSLKIVNGFEITEKLDNSKNLLEISGTGTLSNKENISITSTGSQSFNGKINLSKILNITSDGKLTIATQSDFTNAGNILAVGFEVNATATGIFTNEGTIDSTSGDVKINSARFTNGAEKEIFAKNMSIDSGAVTNAGILTTTGDLLITATSITNSGKIKAQNGELETTEANILFGENSENTFTGKLVVTTATDFENNGIIIASEFEVNATTDFENNGTIEVTSGNFSANVNNNFANNSQITVTTGKLLVNPVINFTNAGNILAVGFEVNATGVFTNDGTITSTSGDVKIKSASFTNDAEKEIFAKNMSIDSGTVTNAGILTATGDLVVNATGDFTSQGKVEVGSELNIKSQNCTVANEISAGTILLEVSTFKSTGNLSSTGDLSITATSITNFGKIEAQNGELETTEANILFGENSENTFTGKLVVKTATDFENNGIIIASEFEVNATGIFTNEGTITSTSGDVNIKSASFTNDAEKEIFAKNMSIDSGAVTNAGILTTTGDLSITATSITNSGKIEAQNGELETTEANILFGENSENTFTGKLVVTTATDFENKGTIIASEFEVNATTDFENKGTIEVTSGNFSANVNNNFANNSQITVTTGKLLVNPVINFTNAGNILAVGFEVNATGIFTNEGTITSTSGDVKIKSASFTNDAEKEIFAKNMSIDSGAVTNAGILTTTGDLSITATSITNSGKIEAQNGELETTEANILFGENSENTFTGKLVVTTATDFENNGIIIASEFEVNATGIFTNEGTITSTSGDVNIKSASFTNDAEKEIFAKNMSIDSGAVTNAGILKATSDLVVNATGEFISQGKVEVGSELNIKSQNCTIGNEISAGTILLEVSTFESTGNLSSTGDLSITATSITNSGKIEAQNGEMETTEANILFGENSENTFTGKLVITTATDFENNGTIKASEFEVNATTDFENKGTIEVTSGNFSANVKNNFANNSQITVTTGKLLVNPVVNFTNAGNILAVGFEVNATGIFTNDGTITSTSGDVNIKSASFTNGAEKEIFAKNMSIDSGAVTNAGLLTTTGDLVVNATGDFTSQGKVEVGSELNIKSQNCIVENEISAGTIILEVSTFESTGNLSSTGDLLITATSITNSGKIEAQNGELETTEANILFGENSENTFTGKLVVKTATDFENNGIIIASEFEVNATGEFISQGKVEVGSELNIKSQNCTVENEISAGTILLEVSTFESTGNLSSTGDLLITATSITNSGKIKAQNGEMKTTEANILFGENSENTFTGKLVVTTATDFENKGTIKASEFEVNATTDFENKGTIEVTSGNFSANVNNNFINNSQITVTAGKLLVNPVINFTNAGNILAVEFEVNATGDFTSQGKVEVGSELNIKSQNCTVANEISAGTILLEVSTFESTGNLSSTGDLSIIATSITNSGKIEAQNGELETTEANILFEENSENTFTGKLVVTTATDFENKGTIKASEFEVNATGEFISQGKVEVGSELNIKSQNCTIGNEISAGTILLEVSTFESTGNLSSTGDLSITATSITNSGKIEAQNGELETTEANILFGENSENTFTGKLVITTATDFENKGIIIASGFEVNATGIFTNDGTTDSTSGDVNIKSASFTNGAEKEIFAKNMSIDSGAVINAGILTATGDLLISATSITNSGKIEAQNGELETTEANILFGENSENIFTGKLVVTTATDFENKGTIIASEFEVNATTDFENKGTIEVTSGNFSANVKNNFANNSQITVTTGKLLVNPVINFTNAGNILASEFEVNATGIFTNEGTIDSTSGDVNIKSASFINSAEKEIFAKNMNIDSGAVTNAGILTTTGDLVVNATGDFTSRGKVEVGSELNIKSQNCTVENEISAGTIILEVSTFESTGNLSSTGELSITATSITNSGKIEAQNGEMKTTEANILFGENSENTFTGKLVVTTATDFENNGIIVASEFEVNATTDFENKGTIEVTSENFSANVKNNFANNSQITVTTGKLLVNPVVNFTNAGNILAVGFEVNATGIFTNEGTIASKDISINSPTVILAGTINAETNISISGNLYITGESSISFGENFFVGTAEYPKDIYISALDSNNEAASVNFISKTEEVAKIQLYGNFALFNGNVSLGTELVVGKDMILLNGKTSGEKPIYKDSMTGFDLFKYHLDGRPVSCNLEAFPTEIPNNENIKISHEEYKSTFMVENGKTISVGKNFYSNGVNLGTDENQWTLKIPANDLATSSFAECYNATITNCVVAANTTPGNAWLSTENCTDGTGNTNVAFSKAIFANVATISDNIIRVSFVDGNSSLEEINIENSCNEISSWMETDNFRFNISSELPEGVAFSGIFANPECTESTDGKGDLSTFYLKYEIPTDGSIDYRWNTDATGSDSGAEESTDYSRNHKNVVPNLLFKRAIEASYAGLRDEHKNRLVSVGTNTTDAEPLFEATKDEAPPVLIAVTLGQERHETEATAQHHYDSHNFIEWQFSEPVEFENYPENGISQIDGVETSAESENIQSTTNFGKITNNGNGFSVAGFGSFETGKVSLGSKTGSGEVNAFYRKFALEAGEEAIAQKNRIRLSIAGYVDKEVVVNGVDYKNWLGFIDSKNTSIPSGTFTMSEEYSKSIKDLAGNEGISPKDSIITNAIYSSMSQDLQTKTLYGTWDIDPPVVANYMKETSSVIYAQELLAVNNTGGNTAESLEIHFLDNSDYNTLEEKNNLQWRTKIGWKENNVQINQTIPLDTKGGSRMTSDYNKTLGGLRFSTIIDSLDAFVCQNIITKEYIDLIESEAGFSQTTTNKNIFGESDVNQFDVPYLTLKFEDAKGSLLKHNYELKYNTESQKKGFITDLAGNLLYDFTVNSPDKNPPQFLLSIGGVNYDKLYILFSKPIDYLNQNNESDEGKLRRIVKSLSVFESTPDGEKDTGLIDYKLGSKAKVVTKTKESTGIEISLTRKVSYDELKNLYIGVNTFDSTITDEDADSSLGDPITGEPGEYSMLYDMFENPISEDSKHCFSDFAVNAFDVLYAYDGRAVEEAALAQGVFGGNQWTVTDFSGETNNSSKIIAGKDITIAGKIVDSSESPDEQDKFSMLADISPAKNKAGLDFEDYTDIKTRLWFPDFVKLFPVNNSSTSENFTTDNLVDNGKIETDIDGKDNNIFTYVIPNNKDDSQSVNWADGDEFEFLFKIYNSDNEVVMVDGNVDGDTDDEVDHPLFALRLKDENDITSIDLWSLHIVELVRQKGGTTILNNVINSLNNEETVVEVQVPQTGFLTVQVLTLDGNVVKVLQRGRVEEGTYYYKWNGTNISGAAVARGMYFVRVVGPNIDETRKVMVIKE